MMIHARAPLSATFWDLFYSFQKYEESTVGKRDKAWALQAQEQRKKFAADFPETVGRLRANCQYLVQILQFWLDTTVSVTSVSYPRGRRRRETSGI